MGSELGRSLCLGAPFPAPARQVPASPSTREGPILPVPAFFALMSAWSNWGGPGAAGPLWEHPLYSRGAKCSARSWRWPRAPSHYQLAPQPLFWLPSLVGLETEHPPLPGSAPLNPAGWGIAPTPCGPPSPGTKHAAGRGPRGLGFVTVSLAALPRALQGGTGGCGARDTPLSPPGPSVARSPGGSLPMSWLRQQRGLNIWVWGGLCTLCNTCRVNAPRD